MPGFGGVNKHNFQATISILVNEPVVADLAAETQPAYGVALSRCSPLKICISLAGQLTVQLKASVFSGMCNEGHMISADG